MYNVKQQPRSSWPRKRLFIAVAVILGIAVVIAALELTNTTHLFHRGPAVSGTIKSTSNTPSSGTAQSGDTSKDNTASQPTPATNPSPKVDTPPPTPNTPLVAPYGTFISNHHPGANGSPLTEQSACTTTAGASCYISFTQGNVVRKLAAQTTDQNGSTTWNWDITSGGLTAGKWTVAATATLNGQTKTTTDPTPLEVSQ